MQVLLEEAFRAGLSFWDRCSRYWCECVSQQIDPQELLHGDMCYRSVVGGGRLVSYFSGFYEEAFSLIFLDSCPLLFSMDVEGVTWLLSSEELSIAAALRPFPPSLLEPDWENLIWLLRPQLYSSRPQRVRRDGLNLRKTIAAVHLSYILQFQFYQ